MGIKLNYYAVILFAFLTCCTVTRKNVPNDTRVKEEDYIKAYKAVVLYGCINEGTKGKFYNFLKENNDLTLFSEVDILFHSTSALADSLGRVYARKIKPFTYGDGEGKVPNFSRCFLYAISNEIDSIAKESYRQMLNK